MINQDVSKPATRWGIVLLTASIGLVIILMLNISLGSVDIPISAIGSYLFKGTTSNGSWDLIIGNFRLPKSITAMLAGAALGISGLQMQTLFKNPLAGPYVLGISSGAGLGAALAIFLGFQFGSFLELTGLARGWLMVVSSGLGAFLVLLVVVLSSSRLKDGVTLLIVGLMFGAASGALVSILQFFSQADNIQAYVIWSFGSLGSLSWTELKLFIPIITIGLIMSIFLSKPLNALLLGESYAGSLGLNIKRSRFLIIVNTSLLAGTVTAFCGPIAFIGIALPHVARMLFSTTNHLLLTPLIILLGATAMLLFDLIAQLPGVEATLPINAVTAILGAPFVIYLILRKRSLNYSYA
ncbi:MAG: iron ABC transporter permease [Cyclobacteriaceae bacterium]